MSELLTKLKMGLKEARRERNGGTKAVLSSLIGELENDAARNVSQPVTDEIVVRKIRSFIKTNKETIKAAEALAPLQTERLRVENSVLEKYLPDFWDEGVTCIALKVNCALLHEIIEAPSYGKAVGLAMNYFKAVKAPVEGATVAKVITEIRTQ